MAWDFSTEPEFEEKLEWMRGFVRSEVFPLETLDLTYDQVRVAIRPLQEEVKAQGLWAAHLPPDLGGMGFGQVRLGLMHEILGQSPWPGGLRQQRARLRQCRVAGGRHRADAGNEEQRAGGCSPCSTGELRSAFSMTEPNTAGSDPTLLTTSAVRDGDEYVINGHKWFTSNGSVADFLIVMAVTNPDIHPYQGSSMLIVPVDTPGVDIVRDVATMEDPTRPTAVSATTPRSSTATCASRPAIWWGGRATVSSWPSSGSDLAASTTACAGWASPAGPSTCSASGRFHGTPTARCWPRSRRSRTGWPTRWRRCRRPG